MQLLGLASTLGIDVEMVITAHELKHIYIFLDCGKHCGVHFCPFVRLDQRICLGFLWFYVECRTIQSLLVLVRPMTAKAGTDFEASVVSNIN